MEEQIVRIQKRLHESRRSLRWKGILAGGLGFLTIADFWTAVPVPLVGPPAILAGLIGLLAGGYLLWLSQELPVQEALDLAALYDGYLSGPLLVRSLRVTPDTADRILRELIRRGYAQLLPSALESGEEGYHVAGLKAPPERPSLTSGTADD